MISSLFTQMGLDYRIYDVGRRIQPLDTETFLRVEQQLIPYPAPYLRQAWLALLLRDSDSPALPLLWFIRLPLDEQGFLDPQPRDRLVKQLLIALAPQESEAEQARQLAAVLENNPCLFQPAPERQASMHARASLDLALAPGEHYGAALDYLAGDLGQWQQLPLQGLADVAMRCAEHSHLLQQAIATMPAQPLQQLCECLENTTPDKALATALCQRLQTEAPTGDSDSLVAALVRALSHSDAIELRQTALQQLLSGQPGMEVLAAIASRCPWDLTQPTLFRAFLQSLQQHPTPLLQQLLNELLYDPRLRPHLLPVLRDPQLEPELQQAVARLLAPADNPVRH
ncbi:DUF3549 family protein [Pseudomaricurvus sp. HS19]|uniref:DUF3549 family protein n=1 Tax=Pseudomaricurvus sp. HS19 TaxID=2692626 RepID=UPI00136E7A40|nr:DUF3549 family protein [Pseudomaricurvus sp. HS19]MYM64989.1 DUF3549 family protein [Pseudomaricurvus sp. HS19]